MNVWRFAAGIRCFESFLPDNPSTNTFRCPGTDYYKHTFKELKSPANLLSSLLERVPASNKTGKIRRSLLPVNCGTYQSLSIICWCYTNWVSVMLTKCWNAKKTTKEYCWCKFSAGHYTYCSVHTKATAFPSSGARDAVDLMISRTKVRPYAVQVDESSVESNVI